MEVAPRPQARERVQQYQTSERQNQADDSGADSEPSPLSTDRAFHIT